MTADGFFVCLRCQEIRFDIERVGRKVWLPGHQVEIGCQRALKSTTKWHDCFKGNFCLIFLDKYFLFTFWCPQIGPNANTIANYDDVDAPRTRRVLLYRGVVVSQP